MTYEEAETLLGQAVALNIIAETCALFDECCYAETTCPYFDFKGGGCALSYTIKGKFAHVNIMEKQALEVLNKGGKKNNDK